MTTLPDGIVVGQSDHIPHHDQIHDLLNQQPWFNPRAQIYGAVGDGVADDRQALLDTVTAAAAVAPLGAGVVIPPGSYRIGSNVTFSAAVSIWFMPGAVLVPDVGVTVTINGTIMSTPRRIFDGLGTFAFGTISRPILYPQWWGAVGDGATDDTVAIQAAFDVAGANRIWFRKGDYMATTLTLNKGGMLLTGDGPNVSIIKQIGGTVGDLLQIGDNVVSFSQVTIENLGFEQLDDASGWAINLRKCSRSRIHNCQVASTSTGSGAISWDGGHSNSVSETWISDIKGIGVRAINAANMLAITDSIFEGLSDAAGVLLEFKARGLSVKGSVFETAAIGIQPGNATNIGGCYFENLGTAGIQVDTTSGSVRGLTIVGNEFQDDNVSIDLVPPAGGAVSGVQCHSNEFNSIAYTIAPYRVANNVAGVIGPDTGDNAVYIDGTRGLGLIVIGGAGDAPAGSVAIGIPGAINLLGGWVGLANERALVWQDPGGASPGGRLASKTLTVANDGIGALDLPVGTGSAALIIVADSIDQQAIFSLGPAATFEIADPSADYSVTAGNAGTTNIYWDAGDVRFELENKTGAGKVYRIWYFLWG